MNSQEIKRLKKNNQQLQAEVDYYKSITIKAGKGRLGDVVQLSDVISQLNDTKLKLEQAQKELEAKVTKRTRELFQKNLELNQEITERRQLEKQLLQAQKIESLGTLAGGIAHDFNNILSAIVGYTEFIQDAVQPDSTIGKDAAEVLSASNRAVKLVKQILTFSQKTGEKKKLLHPHIVIKEALTMLRATLPTTITLEDNIDFEHGVILADPTNIHQIIVNLCTNARHAMDEDKGILRVALQRHQVSAEGIPPGEDVTPGFFVRISVSDTGCGMEQDTIDRIFEPYYTTKDISTGTGLGLAVVHGIVQSFHGFVEVASRLGKGTTFFVYLPLTEERAISAVTLEQKDIKEIIPDNTRILIVDDEPLLVKINKKRLEEVGYQVSAVTNSTEALEMFRSQSESFDLLVTDQTMPGLTGADLAKAVLEITPSLPIIMCTGHSDILPEEKAMSIGIRKYVFKPLQGDELLDAVQEVLTGQ